MPDLTDARSSRNRYRDYRRRIKKDPKDAARDAVGEPPVAGAAGRMGKSTHRTRPFGVLLRAFLKLLGEHRLTLAAALGTLALATLLALIPLYGTKLVFDNVLDDKPIPREVAWLGLPTDQRQLLGVIGMAMISVAVVAVLLGIWGRWQATRITKRVQAAHRRRVFDHAVRLPLHRVYDLKSGGVASILREDAGGVGELVFSMVYNPARAVIQLVGSLGVLALVNWKLLLGALLLLPTVWLTHKTWISRIRPIFRDIRNTRQGIDAHAAEAFGGIRVVRAFGRRRSEARRFTTDNHLMNRQELLAWWWSRGIDIAWSLLIPVASAVLLWYGGGQVLADAERIRAGSLSPADAFTTGDLVMFLAYLTALLGPIAALAESATGLQNQLAGFDRTLDLLQEDPEMKPRGEAAQLAKADVAGRITLQDVSFTYQSKEEGGKAKDEGGRMKDERGTKQNGDSSASSSSFILPPSSLDSRPSSLDSNSLVLHDVNVDVLPGQVVALVGPSGAGKTTLCNLVARFYDPTHGAVKLDGVDLRDIDVDSYRQLLGIVEQDTFLFDGTVAENISYGKRDATDEQIADAARRANAHDFIQKLPKGYGTWVGERGVKLSGGQRQRLTIARAILADPKILILDEATSNLDTESERLIQQSLGELMQGRTSFVIAHRLSTIRHADRILVLEQGRVVEEGTHDELMERSGRYRQMVDLQTRPPEPVKLGATTPPTAPAMAGRDE